jgi:peptidoglycan/xylan/chitin deacetylase (PgdA/CDA1 family)
MMVAAHSMAAQVGTVTTDVARRVSALIYHDVVARERRDSVGFQGAVAGAYKLEPSNFSAHLAAIADSGVIPGLFSAGARALMTFDDGGGSALWIADQLERRGWRGAFFVVTARIGTPGFLNPEDVRDLHRRGHEVGSHSHTHPAYMGKLSSVELAHEWRTSREVLAEVIGAPTTGAAVPGGSVSRELVEQAARAGFERLYTSTPGVRVKRHAEMCVIGRYTIWAKDRPEVAAGLARGALQLRTRRRVSWEVKSAAKRISPRIYEAVRAARADRL